MASTKIPTFPNIDFSKLDFSKLDLSKFDLSKFNVSKFNLDKLPKVEVPKVDLPKVDGETVVNAAKDAAYISVGVAVLAFQKAQVLRRDFSKSINGQVGNGKLQLDEIVSTIDNRLAGFEGKFDAVVAEVGKKLPEPAAAKFAQAHGATKSVRKQVRENLGSTAA